ncbi:RidA family protein, partial [Arthrospira platensis SPKY1]|nr:RidA family protein [Arthrospira platensis SPKY1]
NYLPFQVSGNVIYLAGVLPIRDGQLTHTGAVGADQTVEAAQEAARVCALNALATLKSALGGDWGKLKQILSVTGFVQGVAGFSDSPTVLNGASDLLVAVLGEAG